MNPKKTHPNLNKRRKNPDVKQLVRGQYLAEVTLTDPRIVCIDMFPQYWPVETHFTVRAGLVASGADGKTIYSLDKMEVYPKTALSKGRIKVIAALEKSVEAQEAFSVMVKGRKYPVSKDVVFNYDNGFRNLEVGGRSASGRSKKPVNGRNYGGTCI